MDKTQCSICDKYNAEWDCQRCEEPVCEDCTVVHTYHNQLEGTFCSNCYPNETTMGEIHERNKPKTMEKKQLTSLSVGSQLHSEVIEAWCRPENGKNIHLIDDFGDDMIWSFSTNVFGNNQGIKKVTYVDLSEFHIISTNSNKYLAFRMPGFVEFYNKFYKLDILNSLKNSKIFCKDHLTTVAVHNKLSKLGYLWGGALKKNKTVITEHGKLVIYIYCDGSLGWNHYDNGDNLNGNEYRNLKQIYAEDFLLNEQIINTPLNNKIDGKTIIVCKPVTTIAGGKRPEGTSISGKTRSATVRIGHLSYRAINS